MYAQAGEDTIILEFFKDKQQGLYLDIGAGEWQLYSNTLDLYEKGWNGYAIDPFQLYEDGWIKNRPKDKFLLFAISDYDGKINMSDTMMDGGIYYKEYSEERHIPVRTVDCLKFSTLCERYPDIFNTDFCSIDVETSEDRVLSTVDFDKFKPSLICIENKTRGVDNTSRWIKYLDPYYKVINETSGNAFYTRR